MDWLKPHISQIDNFYTSLNGSRTYVHIPKTFKRKCSCGTLDCRGEVEHNHIQEQYELLKYRQLMEEGFQRKTQPVSVIVSDQKLRSESSSSVPSPTSSISDNGQINGDTDEKYDSSTTSDKQSGDLSASQSKRAKMGYTYKPVPMVRKSRRQFICDEKKDKEYWDRRRRNNEAAKKSRESRREKEIEVNRKCSDLEKENTSLRFNIVNLQDRNTQLENTLQMYQELLIKNNLL